MPTPMRFYSEDDWQQWLTDHARPYETDPYSTPRATEPQARYLQGAFGVPDDIINRMSRRLAALALDQLVTEKKQWKARQEQQRAERARQQAAEAARREQLARAEQEARAEAARLGDELEARRQPAVDRKTGLVGSPSQCKWADRIRTSLKPYLEKLRATAPDPELADLYAYAQRVTDATYWIAHKSADMKDADLTRMMEDARRRRETDSGLIGWGDIPDMTQKMKSWKGPKRK